MIIGIDTSCYTTSLALIGDRGELVWDHRRLLQVERGKKGLRQSEAVFQHVRHLPELVEEALPGNKLTAVIASNAPRPVAGSYMPVFTVGASFGKAMAGLWGVPFWQTSHQEGHIRAGLYRKEPQTEPFLAWHISGGTTELLVVAPTSTGYTVSKIGESSDLHAGQYVDRIGVALGAPFPAGPYLEKLAAGYGGNTRPTLPVAVDGLTLSLSGPATAAERLVKQKTDPAEIAWQVFCNIGRSLWRVTLQAVKDYRINRVLIVGGVASNQLIRAYLTEEGIRHGVQFIFGPRELSSDNAVGVALLGYDKVGNIE